MVRRLKALEGKTALLDGGRVEPLKASRPTPRATATERWQVAIDLCRAEGARDPLREAGRRFNALRLAMLAEVNGRELV